VQSSKNHCATAETKMHFFPFSNGEKVQNVTDLLKNEVHALGLYQVSIAHLV